LKRTCIASIDLLVLQSRLLVFYVLNTKRSYLCDRVGDLHAYFFIVLLEAFVFLLLSWIVKEECGEGVQEDGDVGDLLCFVTRFLFLEWYLADLQQLQDGWEELELYSLEGELPSYLKYFYN